VCKGVHLYYEYPATKDNRDSWGTCTTSVECKIVIAVVLMFMSSMDPHKISGNLGWVLVKSWLGGVELGLLECWSVTV
jgi:hypothetical protein